MTADQYKALVEEARRVDVGAIGNDILMLASDPRFVSVMAWLDWYRHRATIKAAAAETGDSAMKSAGRLGAIVDLLAELQRYLQPRQSAAPHPEEP